MFKFGRICRIGFALSLSWLPWLAAAQTAAPIVGADDNVARQSRDDAWWTGPMLANSAETLPPGHFLFEPYIYDVRSSHDNAFGSRAYILYGLAQNLSVGVIPIIGYNRTGNGSGSSNVGMGDFSVEAQYRLREFQEGSWLPTVAVQLMESFPSGKYDRLGDRPGNGLGSGARATTLAINTQTFFWMPSGRILRMRLDVSQTFSERANVRDVSVYGTDDGFRGHAQPGPSLSVDAAWEYSLTQRWVLALDLTYNHNGNTHVSGYQLADDASALPLPSVELNSGPGVSFGLAPAIEYNWSPNAGLLFGTRFVFGNQRTTATVTPAIAFIYVY
jgi:hypothetical protein